MRLSVEEVADASWFVISVYVIAFAPWVYYGFVDHVDGRWQEVNKLKTSTWTALIWFLVSLVVLLIYIVFQIIASDWKEAMAAIVVLGGTGFPLQRVLRQCWILSANAKLEQFLSPFGVWNPSNSNQFFDNDSPGEGVRDISLMQWWKGSQCPVRPGSLLFSPRHWNQCRNGDVRELSRVSTCGESWPGPDVESWSNDTWPSLYQRMKLTRRERGIMEASMKHELRMLAGSSDRITRTLWLFENLPGGGEHDEPGMTGRTMKNIVRVGLAAQVCHRFCNGYLDFPWLDWLAPFPVLSLAGVDPDPDSNDAMGGNSQASGETLTRELEAYGRRLLAQKKIDAAVQTFRTGRSCSLPFAVLNIQDSHIPETQNDEDFFEAYQKLPVSRRSTRACGHILWQHVMQMISTILEVAFVVETLLGFVDCKGVKLPFSAVTKHAACYAAARSQAGLHEDFRTRMAFLQENWLGNLEIERHCHDVAESLALGMAKSPYDRPEAGWNFVSESAARLKRALHELGRKFNGLSAQGQLHKAQPSTSSDTRVAPPADVAVPAADRGREDV